MAEKKLVPELRFPEFDGEWKCESIGYIFAIRAGGDISEKHIRKHRDNLFKYPIYANAEKEKGLYGYSDVYKEEGGVITVAGRGVNIGIAHARNHRFFPIVRLLVLAPKSPLDTTFFEYTINNLHIFIESTGVPQLTAPQFSKYNLKYPPIQEQYKIASFLSSIDDCILLLEKKKKALERYKKGVVQKIFKREIRFKDDEGKDFLDWEERTFGELYTFKQTNSFSREKLNYTSGTIKNVHYGDVHTKFSSHLDISKAIVPFINEDINVKKISEDTFIQEGDLIIADASEDYTDIGKTLEIINTNGEKVLSGLHTFLARRVDNRVIIGFGGYLMKSPEVRSQIMKIAQGTKVLSVSSKRLAEIKIKIPTAYEQQKITSFLTAIDISIYHTTYQLNYAKTHKKGLLQKMFV